jgi:hypothetical protein
MATGTETSMLAADALAAGVGTTGVRRARTTRSEGARGAARPSRRTTPAGAIPAGSAALLAFSKTALHRHPQTRLASHGFPLGTRGH